MRGTVLYRASSLLVVVYSSSSSSANVAVELDSIFAVNTEKVDLIMHSKMSFLFTTEYAVKIRLQLQILC